MTQTPSPSWVHTLAPYQPGKPIEELERELGLTDIIKLASNENPLGPSPAAVAAIAARAIAVNFYPDASSHRLRARLGAHLGCDPGRVLVGNGSNELITHLVRAFATPAENVVISQYGFVAYRLVAEAAGVPVRSVPEQNFEMDVAGLVAACDADTRVMFVANPNNPTGTFLGVAELTWLLERTPAHVLVVVDEAYFEYAREDGCPDALSLLDARENVVVMRTFSKAYGLAGCRVGYAVAPAYVAERVNRIREPFDVNDLGQVAALAALDDVAFVERTVRVNRDVREQLRQGLQALHVRQWPSAANFVLFRAPISGARVYDGLLRRGVIVRPMGAYGLPDHVRVTVGTHDENQRFLRNLAELIAEAE